MSDFPGALNVELEAMVEAAYDAGWESGCQRDLETSALVVYADWLHEKGHPLGEQLVLELSGDSAASAAGRAIRAELYGAGLPIGEEYGAAIRVTWRFGLIESVELKTTNKKVIAGCLAALVRLPTARFVRTITVANAASVDVAQLALFPSIRGLEFEKGTPDLAPFSGGRLRTLSLPLLDASTAGHIESLPALTNLRVRDCTLDRALEARTLECLSIGDRRHRARSLSSLEVATKLDALESLTIEGSAVRSLAPLAGLASLRYLTVAGAKTLGSLEGVERLTKLAKLDVNMSAVGSLEPLRTCRALREVNIRGTKVKDLSPLWELAALDSVFAEKTKVRSLDGIGKLGALRTLWIFDTPVRDLAPLAGVPSLEVLNIAGLVDATGLDVLATLPKLRSLDAMLMKPPFDPEIVARAPVLDRVRGCDWPPASRMTGKPLG